MTFVICYCFDFLAEKSVASLLTPINNQKFSKKFLKRQYTFDTKSHLKTLV